MGQDATIPTDPFEKIFLINEEIRSKPKAKLTNSIQDQINDAMSGEQSDLFDRLIELQGKLTAPVKQGVAEYLRLNPVKGDLASNATLFLKFLKEKTKSKGLLKYFAALALLSHHELSENDGILLKSYLASSKSNKKKISKKIETVFCNGDFHWMVTVLYHCKETIPEFEKEVWDNLKKPIADKLHRLLSDGEDSNTEQTIVTLEKLMQDQAWIQTPRDPLLKQKIEEYRTKAVSKTSSKDYTLPLPLFNEKGQSNILHESKPSHVKNSPGFPKSQRVEKEKHNEKGSSSEFITKQESKSDLMLKDPNVKSPDETIPINGLDPSQQKLLDSLVKEFKTTNLKTKHQINNLKKLAVDSENLKFDCNELRSENEIYLKEIEELTDKVDMLRRRLEERNAALDREKTERQLEKCQFDKIITDLTEEIDRGRIVLQNRKTEIERERQLSHSTHRDAVNRAEVELQTKLTQISQNVVPIFKEFEDFLVFQDNASEAGMLFRIAQKLKNALRNNGVKV